MADYDTEVLADSPVCYSKGELASGVTEAELSTNARTVTWNPQSGGSWTGGTLAQTGPSSLSGDKAPLYNGTSGYAEVGSHAKISSATSGTVEAWVYVTANPTQDYTVFAMGCDGSSNGLRVLIADVFGNGTRRLKVYDRSGANFVYGNTSLALNTWYHVVAQSTGTAWQLYVNGTAQTLTVNGTNTGVWFGGETFAGNVWSTIGAAQRFGAVENYATARISRVAVYNTVLSSTRINAHYSNINTAPAAPNLTSPTGTATGATTATLGVTTDTGNGTLYAVASTSATPPTAAQVEAGQDSSGAAAPYAGSQAVSSSGAKTFSATGLTASTTYYAYFAQKSGAGIDSTVAASASFTTSAANNPPNTPTLTAGTPTDTTCPLTGSAFSDPDVGDTQSAAQWQVTTSADTTYATPVVSTGDDATHLTSYTATGLTGSTAYRARVRYKDNHGNYSSWSTDATFTTAAPTAPAAPSSLTATAVSPSEIDLSWTDNSSNETGFKVDMADDSGFITNLVSVTIAANSTSYASVGLNPSTTKYYRVRATNAVGDSANSNTASATTQADPTLGTSVANGGTDALGNLTQNSTVTRTYTLHNNGGSALHLGTVTVGTGLTITTDPSGTAVAAGASATLAVSVATASTGSVSAAVTIPSDDPASPYAWTVTATVVASGRLLRLRRRAMACQN